MWVLIGQSIIYNMVSNHLWMCPGYCNVSQAPLIDFPWQLGLQIYVFLLIWVAPRANFWWIRCLSDEDDLWIAPSQFK